MAPGKKFCPSFLSRTSCSNPTRPPPPDPFFTHHSIMASSFTKSFHLIFSFNGCGLLEYHFWTMSVDEFSYYGSQPLHTRIHSQLGMKRKRGTTNDNVFLLSWMCHTIPQTLWRVPYVDELLSVGSECVFDFDKMFELRSIADCKLDFCSIKCK